MNSILNFIKTRKVWYYLVFASTVLGIVGLVLYFTMGTTKFDTAYSPGVLIGLIAGVSLGVFSLVKTYSVCLYGQYIGFFYAFLSYLTSNMNLYGSLAYGVDGESIPTNFFIITAITLVIFVIALVSAIMMKSNSADTDKANSTVN